MGREEMMTRAAMHTTSDFPELLTGAGNRVLANAYTAAQSPLSVPLTGPKRQACRTR